KPFNLTVYDVKHLLPVPLIFTILAVVFRTAFYNATTAQFYFSGFRFLKKFKTWHTIYNFDRMLRPAFRAFFIINSHFSSPLCYIAVIINPLLLCLIYF